MDIYGSSTKFPDLRLLNKESEWPQQVAFGVLSFWGIEGKSSIEMPCLFCDLAGRVCNDCLQLPIRELHYGVIIDFHNVLLYFA